MTDAGGEKKKKPRARSVLCGCGWTGRRYDYANVRPCPVCGGVVYLSPRTRGRPRKDMVRVEVRLKRRWAEIFDGRLQTVLREALAERLRGEGYDPAAD